MFDALDIAILIYDSEFVLRKQNSKAETLFGFILGSTLVDNFGAQETRGTIRRLSRGKTPSFTVEHASRNLIEFVTSIHDGEYILQGFENKSLYETQILLENYSVNLEQQNHQISTLLDEALWLNVSIEQAVRPIFMVDNGFHLRFMNESAKKVFVKYHRAFATLIPQILTEELLGLSLKNLPIFQSIPEQSTFSTHFVLKGEHFECHAKHVFKDGVSLGFCVEIENITQEYIRQRELARMQDMIEGMGHPTMLCDESGLIRYINPACIALLFEYGQELESIWSIPHFEPGLLLGRSIQALLDYATPTPVWSAEPNQHHRVSLERERFSLHVTVHSLTDHVGAFSGYVVEWSTS